MRSALLATIAGAAVLGGGIGWLVRSRSPGEVRVVTLPAPSKTLAPPAKQTSPSPKAIFPDYPKPPLDTPRPKVANAASVPPPLYGDVPNLPLLPATGPIGPLAPAIPDVAQALPNDLNADEALARRTILAAGAEIVSSGDAKDASGKVGRSLVVEIAGSSDRLQSALRQALGGRIVLSDGGSSYVSTPEIRKQEDALATLRKQRDAARIDFLPNAPVLIDIEDATLKQERSVAETKKKATRQRLNILLHSPFGA